MENNGDDPNEWEIREMKGGWKDNLRRKSGKDLSIRFLQSGTIGIWKGYCRECDFTTIESESFLDTTDKLSLHHYDSRHEVIVAGNAGEIGGDLMMEVTDLFGTRFSDACKQCGAEDEGEYFTSGLCDDCR